MPSENYQIFSGKGIKKELTLELSEDEDILECIKQGMMQNNVTQAKVKEIQGKIKQGTVTYFLGPKFKSKEIENENVLKASGQYELKGAKKDELFGNLHIVLGTEWKKNTVTITKATATEGLKIMLSFIEIK